MKKLKRLIAEQLENCLTEKNLASLISKEIDSLVKGIVIDQLSIHSNFGKAVEEVVKAQMQVNLSNLDLSSYNKVIASAVHRQVKLSVNAEMLAEIGKGLDKIFEPAPTEISLNDLCEKLLESYWDDNLDAENLHVEFKTREFGNETYTLEVKDSERHGNVIFNLFLMDGEIKVNHKMAYNPTCMSEIEEYIFKCYAAKTKITDIDDFNQDASCFCNPHLDI